MHEIATRSDDKDLIEFLIKYNADMNRKDQNGWTALDWGRFFNFKTIII